MWIHVTGILLIPLHIYTFYLTMSGFLEMYIRLIRLVLLNLKGKIIIISSIVLSVYYIVVSITFTFTFTCNRHHSVTVFSNRHRWRWSCVVVVVTSVRFVRFVQMVVYVIFDRWFLVFLNWSDFGSFKLRRKFIVT